MKEYGDDYVPPTFGDGRGNTEDFDITSELLEAEFEENSPESLDTEEPFVVSSENESVDEIDGLIEQLGEDFDDPNKLLKALERLDTKPKDLDNEHNTPIKKQGTILVNRTNASSTDSKVVSGEISEKETISEVKRPVQLQQEDTESKENLVDEKISLKANALCVEEPNESPIIKPITETMPETMQADVKVKTDDDWEENSKISEVTKEKDSANSPRQENTVVPLQEEKKRRLTEINQIMIELQNEIQVKEHELQELENKKPKRAFGFARTMKKWYRNIFGKNSAMGKEQVQAEYQLKKEIDALEAKLSELQKERLDYLRTLENE